MKACSCRDGQAHQQSLLFAFVAAGLAHEDPATAQHHMLCLKHVSDILEYAYNPACPPVMHQPYLVIDLEVGRAYKELALRGLAIALNVLKHVLNGTGDDAPCGPLVPALHRVGLASACRCSSGVALRGTQKGELLHVLSWCECGRHAGGCDWQAV